MSVVNTSQRVATVEFTDQEMKRYFSSPPIWAWVVGSIGILALLVGLAPHSQFCLAVGVIMLLVGGGVVALNLAGKKPTDQEYDAWLDSKASQTEATARNRLNLDESFTGTQPSEPLRVRGIAFPHSKQASVFSDQEVRAKRGKDGRWRFSVNSFTFFFPAEQQLAAYKDVISALKQAEHHESTAEYFYSDIVGATTQDVQEEVMIRDKKYNFRIKQFAVKVSSGDETGAIVGVKPISTVPGEMRFDYMQDEDSINRLVNNMRMLLRSKK